MGFNDSRGGGFGGRGGHGGGRGGFGGGRGGGGFRRSFGGPREMTKITCSECGNEGEVPFKPRPGSAVLCRDCFAKKNGRSPRPQQNNENSDNSDESSNDDSEEM